MTSFVSAHLSNYLFLPNSLVANLLQAASLCLSNFHLVCQWIGFILSVFFSCLLKMKSLQQPLAKSASQVTTAERSAASLVSFEPEKWMGINWARDWWGSCSPSTGGCRRSGVAPLRDVASGCPRPGASPHPPGSRRRPDLAALQTAPTPYKIHSERDGKGEMRRDSWRPFLKAARACRDGGMGKRDRTPEEVPRQRFWVLGEFGGLWLVQRRFTLERRLFAPNPQLWGF